MANEVIVVGGGIAGLSCAWRLSRQGFQVEVLEAQEELGGNVRSEVRGGFLMERGPHTFMRSADDIFVLAKELGIEGEILGSRPEAEARFIVRKQRLCAVPSGPWSFLTTRLLSARGKIKLVGEPLRTQRGKPDDSAEQFFSRRFGPEGARVLAGAFISGVYAGDARTLSAPAAFPLFWRFEQESGGMLRGGLAHRKKMKALRAAQGLSLDLRPKGLSSFRQGLGQLIDALGAQLGDRCRTRCAVRGIGREGGRFVVKTDQGERRAEHLVLAVPPPEARAALQGLNPALADLLGRIPMAPVAVVYLGYDRRLPSVPDGFGFLAPRDEGVRALGVLFPSRLFDGRAPGAGDLLTAYVGGVQDPVALQLDDASLSRIVTNDLAKLLGLSTAQVFVRVLRHPTAIPQFTLGHLERFQKIQSLVREIPGLFLAGNYLRGVGMKDAVGSDFEAAMNVTQHRQTRTSAS